MSNHERKVMRPAVIKALRRLDAMSVENGAHPGTPDVNHLYGWMELKYLKAWPVRPTTPVRVDHFVPGQRGWIGRRVRATRKAGGSECVHVLLKVGREWLLFDGEWAALFLGEKTKGELIEAALGHWTVFDKKDFAACLTTICLSKSLSPLGNGNESSGRETSAPKQKGRATSK